LSSQNYELHMQREEPQANNSLHGGRIRAKTGRTSLQGEPKENSRERILRKRTTSALLEPKTGSLCGGKQELQEHEETRGGGVQNQKSVPRPNTTGEALLLARDRAAEWEKLRALEEVQEQVKENLLALRPEREPSPAQ
jgi:hypothetical protein